MKTEQEQWKDEHLNAFIYTVSNDNLQISPSSYDMIWECMKKYSDQQNKELRERIAKYDEIHKLIGLHPKIEDWTAEIQRLTEEVNRWKSKYGAIATGYEAEIQRLKERNKYLEEHSNERFEQANELNDKDQEIQRLTKEVELLTTELNLAEEVDKSRIGRIDQLTKEVEELKGKAYNSDIQAQNTRLRELLTIVKPYISELYDYPAFPKDEIKQLVAKIDQTLKP